MPLAHTCPHCAFDFDAPGIANPACPSCGRRVRTSRPAPPMVNALPVATADGCPHCGHDGDPHITREMGSLSWLLVLFGAAFPPMILAGLLYREEVERCRLCESELSRAAPRFPANTAGWVAGVMGGMVLLVFLSIALVVGVTVLRHW